MAKQEYATTRMARSTRELKRPDQISAQGLPESVCQSRQWLTERWNTADATLLSIRLLRHAELLERLGKK